MNKLTALVLIIFTLLALVSCEKSGSDNSKKINISSTSAPVTTEEEEKTDPDMDKEKITQSVQDDQWKAAYKDFFSDTNYLKSVYVNDLNRDGIPEVFLDTWGTGCSTAVTTYIKDKGISTFMFEYHSSLGGKLYLELDKKIVVFRDDGHNYGTSNYHQAIKYSLGSNGFEKTDEILADELTIDFDQNDYDAWDRYMVKSRELFDKKFSAFTKGMNLIDYADVAVTKNIKVYLYKELKLEEKNFTGYGSDRYGEGTYTGYYVNGVPNGQGKMVWDNGDIYDGEWDQGQYNGNGTYIWKNGSSYSGDWKNGEMHGYGTYTDADGNEKTGEWENDKFIG